MNIKSVDLEKKKQKKIKVVECVWKYKQNDRKVPQ